MEWITRVVCEEKGAPDEDDAEKRETAGVGRLGWQLCLTQASVFPSVRRKIEPLVIHTLCVTMTLAEKGGGKCQPYESLPGPEPGSPAVSSTQRTCRTSSWALGQGGMQSWALLDPWPFLSLIFPVSQALLALTLGPGASGVWC